MDNGTPKAHHKNLSDIEQNLKRNLKRKEYDEKYDFLNQLEKENVFER